VKHDNPCVCYTAVILMSVRLFKGILMKWLGLYLVLLPFGLAAEEITVVHGAGHYPPYEMQVDGKLTGFHIELIKIISKKLNLTVHFEVYPWKRALSMVEHGDAHAVSFASINAKREKYIIFTPGNELSFAYSGLVVLANRKHEFHFNGKDLNNLSHYKFGSNLGFIFGDYYDKAKVNKQTFNSNDQIYNVLRKKRIDIAVMNMNEFMHRQSLQDGSTKELVMLDSKVALASFIGFSKHWKLQKLSQRFAKESMAFKKTQEFINLKKQFNIIEY